MPLTIGIKRPSRVQLAINYLTPYFKRRIDGTSYNKDHVWWGAAKEDVARDVPAMYADGIAMPAGTCIPEQKQAGHCRYPDAVNGFGSNRPPPRTISNELFRQVRNMLFWRKVKRS